MRDYPAYTKKTSKSLVRKKTETAKKSSIKLALTWIILILVATFFVQQRISYIRKEKNVRELMKIKKELETSILPLKLEELFLTRLSKVEATAKKSLLLQKPIRQQTIIINVNKPLPVEEID